MLPPLSPYAYLRPFISRQRKRKNAETWNRARVLIHAVFVYRASSSYTKRRVTHDAQRRKRVNRSTRNSGSRADSADPRRTRVFTLERRASITSATTTTTNVQFNLGNLRRTPGKDNPKFAEPTLPTVLVPPARTGRHGPVAQRIRCAEKQNGKLINRRRCVHVFFFGTHRDGESRCCPGKRRHHLQIPRRPLYLYYFRFIRRVFISPSWWVVRVIQYIFIVYCGCGANKNRFVYLGGDCYFPRPRDDEATTKIVILFPVWGFDLRDTNGRRRIYYNGPWRIEEK